MKFPHYEREETGYGVLLVEPRSGLVIGLHTYTANDGEQFDEARRPDLSGRREPVLPAGLPRNPPG